MGTVILKRGREKSVLRGHPWLYSGAVRRVEGSAPDGDIVQVLDTDGNYVGTGYINRQSQIRVRLLTRNPDESIDENFFHRRLSASIQRRRRLLGSAETSAYRLVFSEADLLPGLIVDRYGEILVLQCLTLGIERWKGCIADALVDLLQPKGVFERSDVEVRDREALPRIRGQLRGEPPPKRVEIREHSLRFLVDVLNGHKTGFYLDQRENRRKVMTYAADAEVLNCFAYTGGFSVYAAAAGARSVTEVEASPEALSLGADNVALNQLGSTQFERFAADAFRILRKCREEGRQFDLIILDPPKFASARAQLGGATRGYKDINLLAMQLLRPDGILFTFSCSGLVTDELFQKIVFSASVDAHREAQVIERLGQPADHPVLLAFPESRYLKGLVCRVL